MKRGDRIRAELSSGRKNIPEPCVQGNHPQESPTQEENNPQTNPLASSNLQSSAGNHPTRTFCKPDQTPVWKMVLETLALLAALGVALVYWRELDTMLKMNQITKEGMHSSQRAWVGIEDATPLGYEAEAPSSPSVNLTVAFRLKNYGLSAADNIRFLAVLISDPLEPDHLSCDQVEKIKARELLLPSQHSTLNWVMNLKHSDIQAGWAHQNPKLGHILVLRIEGCILYSDRENEPWHRTPFNYVVLRKRPGFITPTESIPGEDLSVEPNFISSNETR